MREEINLKQLTSKTYYSEKCIKREINDNVFVYKPRLNHAKLYSKWNGPRTVKDISYHINLTKMSANIGYHVI